MMIDIIKEIAEQTDGINQIEINKNFGEILCYVNNNTNPLGNMENSKYFFIKADENSQESSDEILTFLEKMIEPIRDDIGRGKARDINVIILYEINKIIDTTYKNIIAIEENVFLYKKSVLYYTKDELNKLKALYKKTGMDFLQLIKNDSYIGPSSMEKPEIQLYLRILIKIPFVRFKFEEKNLYDLSEKIERNIKSKNLEKEYDDIKELGNINDIEMEKHIKKIVKEIKVEVERNEN